MYSIIFYEDSRGLVPTAEYIEALRRQSHTSKHARINLNKIVALLDMLEEEGTRIGEPAVKHLDGEIWELRPIGARILFAVYENNIFILLHHFTKKTQKTPPQEIKQAKRNLAGYRERNDV